MLISLANELVFSIFCQLMRRTEDDLHGHGDIGRRAEETQLEILVIDGVTRGRFDIPR